MLSPEIRSALGALERNLNGALLALVKVLVLLGAESVIKGKD